MRTRNLLFVFVVLSLMIASCAPPAVDMAALRQTIDDYNAATVESMTTNSNSEKALAYYADDAVSMPPNGPALKGREAIKAWIDQMMQSGMKINSASFTVTDVQAAGNVAYEIGTYDMTMTIPGMGDMNDTGKYVAVWKQQADKSWKVAAEIWNTDTPPPAMEPPADTKKK